MLVCHVHLLTGGAQALFPFMLWSTSGTRQWSSHPGDILVPGCKSPSSASLPHIQAGTAAGTSVPSVANISHPPGVCIPSPVSPSLLLSLGIEWGWDEDRVGAFCAGCGATNPPEGPTGLGSPYFCLCVPAITRSLGHDSGLCQRGHHLCHFPAAGAHARHKHRHPSSRPAPGVM